MTPRRNHFGSLAGDVGTAGVGGGVGTPGEIVVPTDGPGKVFVPSTTDHFGALGVAVPSIFWPGEDDGSSGKVAAAIGSLDLSEVNSGHLYRQTVDGWKRKFLGTTEIAGDSGTAWGATRTLSEGESVIELAYALVSDDHTQNSRLFQIAGIGHTVSIAASGGTGQLAGGSKEHRGSVHPFLYVRDTINQERFRSSDLERVDISYGEAEVLDAVVSWGRSDSSNQSVLGFYGPRWRWHGDDSISLINAGLAGKKLITAFGWDVAY